MDYLTYDEITKRNEEKKALEKRISDMSVAIDEKLCSVEECVLASSVRLEKQCEVLAAGSAELALRKKAIAALSRDSRAMVSESGDSISAMVGNISGDNGNEASEAKLRKLKQLLRQRRLSLLQEVAFLFPVENSGGVRSICDLPLDGTREEKGIIGCLVGQALRLLSLYTGVRLQRHIQLLGEKSYLCSNRHCVCTRGEGELWKCNVVDSTAFSNDEGCVLISDDDGSGIRALTEEVRSLAVETARGGEGAVLEELERLMHLCTLEVGVRD